MLIVLLLLIVAYAKENFQITANGISFSTAFDLCFNATSPLTNKTYCSADKGCCNGHGVCVVNSTLVPTCVCGQPIECRPGLTSLPYYTGDQCQNWPTNCCTSGSDDLPFSTYGGCHLASSVTGAVDPELGAKGNLLKRFGPANYTRFRGYYNDSDFQDMVAVLTNSSNPVTHTWGNMMGLGFLEVALKDMVDFKYNMSQNVSIPDENGTIWQYPALQWQANTGVSNVPKMFENTASVVFDLGPLYDFAVRNGSYLNGAPAVNYWNNTHHVSKEFTVALRLYWRYHNYVASAIEIYFWADNSWSGTLTSSTSNPSIGSFDSSWVYEQAKRSTKRFSQAVLEQAALQILLDSPDTSSVTTNNSFWQATFDGWTYRDGDQPYGVGWFGFYKPNVRDNQEFNRGINRTSHAQYLLNEATQNYMSAYALSGTDPFLSMRNPNYNYSYANALHSWDTSGCGTFNLNAYDSLAYDIIALQHTQLQRFGNPIARVYTKDLKLNAYRARELGLGPYAATVGWLTHAPGSSSPPSVADLTQAQKDNDVYYQAHLETNSARQYRMAMSSIFFAIGMDMNNVLITDRTSYWARDGTGNWIGGNYHPDPSRFDVLPAYEFLNCFPGDDPWGYGCDTNSINAAASIIGYHPDMGIYWDECNFDTDPFYERSPGSLFAHPPLLNYQTSDPTSGWPDFTIRQYSVYGLNSELQNALFYQYDGLYTLVAIQAAGTNYVPLQVVDAFATNIGWTNPIWEGLCYDAAFMSSPCSKPFTCDQTYACYWSAPFNP